MTNELVDRNGEYPLVFPSTIIIHSLVNKEIMQLAYYTTMNLIIIFTVD